MYTIIPGSNVARTRFRFPLGARVTADGQPGRISGLVKSYSDLPYVITLDDGRKIQSDEDGLRWMPVVGLGATMHYPSDAVALVITRVTPTTIVTQRVETGQSAPNESFDRGGWDLAVYDAPGILDRPIPGTDARWHLTKRGVYTWQGMRLSLGYSITRRDWRD